MQCIVFDIETAPDPRFWEDAEWMAAYRAEIKPDGRLKNPEKIADDIASKFEDAKDRAALDWCYGRIRAIGWSMLDSEDEPIAEASEDEAAVIGAFAAELFSLGEHRIGGFYIREFDVPFLTMRAAVHNIKLPGWWPTRRPWSNGIVDPTDLFGRVGRLKNYLEALDLPPKLADGSEAPGMGLDELLTYVKRDVECERALIQRLRWAFPALNRPNI